MLQNKITLPPKNEKPRHYRIAFSGGGTGGHVYPALAVLERLQQLMACKQPDATLEILWLGSKNGIEKDILAQHSSQLRQSSLQWQYCGISCGKLRRYFSWQNFGDLFRTALGIWQSYRILRHKRPILLFSKGGFVTVPGIVAAKILGISIFSHESDLDPGLATRLALPLIQTLFLPYKQSRKYYQNKYQNKLEISGNPVRAEFFPYTYASSSTQSKQAEPGQSPNGLLDLKQLASYLIPVQWFNSSGQLRKPLLLVIGGSQGASELNGYVQNWLEKNVLTQFYILHQCGQQDYPELKRNFVDESRALENYHVLPFISEGLGAIYQLCRQSKGFVLSRAGAGSLWEILASGNQAILMPLQSGSRGDQLRNAQLFAQQGWAHCFIGQTEAKGGNSQKLLEQILLILQDKLPCNQGDIPDAALYIAQKIWQQMQPN